MLQIFSKKMINEGESLGRWIKMSEKSLIEIADIIGFSRQKLYRLFQKQEIPESDKFIIEEKLKGAGIDHSKIYSYGEVVVNNKSGNNYNQSNVNIGEGGKVRELEIEIAKLKGENKSLKEVIKLLTSNK